MEVPPGDRGSPGYVLKARHIPTLEEAIYEFPEGVGVAPEEVEEVDDSENYWILKERVLQVASCAEEAKEYVDGKIKHVEDYFDRLDRGELDASELKEKRPENFDEPYLPTPHQLKVGLGKGYKDRIDVIGFELMLLMFVGLQRVAVIPSHHVLGTVTKMELMLLIFVGF